MQVKDALAAVTKLHNQRLSLKQAPEQLPGGKKQKAQKKKGKGGKQQQDGSGSDGEGEGGEEGGVDAASGKPPQRHITLWAREVKGEGAHVKQWRVILRNLPFKVGGWVEAPGGTLSARPRRVSRMHAQSCSLSVSILLCGAVRCGASYWHMAHGTWHMAHGTRHTAHGTRHTAHGTRHMAHGTRHTAHGTRHMAHGSCKPSTPRCRLPWQRGET